LLKAWNNTTSSVDFFRHSDNLVKGHLQIKQWMQEVFSQNGYDGIKMPLKHFICTETGCGRNMDGDNYGGEIPQLNYMLKTQVKTLMDGQIRQMYWFQTGDYKTSAHWDTFGCFKFFGDSTPFSATAANQGIALQTLSALLYGRTYDDAKTKSLNLPASVDGGAFKDAFGKYVYALWAKTTTDMSEAASATVTLPSCIRKEWNYADTRQGTGVLGQVSLNATPSFFEEAASPIPDTPPPPPAPVIVDRGYFNAATKRVYWVMFSDHSWKETNSKYQILT
jgi:hypothetical protein